MADPLEPCLLLTGFEPFADHPENESWLIAQALDGTRVQGLRVQSVCLPCEFGVSLRTLDEALIRHQPAVVVSLGLAASRAELSVERVALNIDDARIPDNAGRQPIDQPIAPEGPAAYWSGLPIKRMVAALRAEGWPASVSQTAGSYVCNHVFYGLMHRLHMGSPDRMPSVSAPAVRGGFIHVPARGTHWPDPHPPRAAWTLEALVQSVGVALDAAVSTAPDLAITGGLID